MNIKVTAALFCAVELVLFGYARTASAAGHVHALHALTPSSSPGEAAAVCAEADAALGDAAPVLLLLNGARIVPIPAVRAWGEVPRFAEAAQIACRSVGVYVSVAPWRDASLEQGAAADVLIDVRQQRQQLTAAVSDLAHAWSVLDTVDLPALSAEPRLERAARALSELRARRADISTALALATPERAETLLGGHGALAMMLEVQEGSVVGRAHAVVDEGRVLAVDVGPPPMPAGVVITVDRVGLSRMLGAVGRVPVPELGSRVSASELDDVLQHAPEGSSSAVARAILQEITQKKLANDVAAVAALKESVEQHRAWLWFADPALQALAVEQGWARL
ncbi:MAG: hypothetical protein LC797_19145 [Chloroflexi bacterium]|nr:hypothetical protein [Chloroflexota bacterium]